MSIGISDDESTTHFDYIPPKGNPFKNPMKEAKTIPSYLLSLNW